MTNLYWVTKIVQYIGHQHSEQNWYWEDGDGGKCVFVWEGYFSIFFEDSMCQTHVIIHLFLNANSLYNCWFYTGVAWFVEHNTWYQNCSKCKVHLLSNMTTWGKYEYGKLLQLIIELIHFRLFSYIYRIISNITWRKYEYRTILELINS